jgi:hypothetical protein
MKSAPNRASLTLLVSLLAVALSGMGDRQPSGSGWLARAQAASMETAEAGSRQAAPMPDAEGNYRVPKRRLAHDRWRVVDPEGLNCRMPHAYRWRELTEPIHHNNRGTSIDEQLWMDKSLNPLQWPVMAILPPDTVVTAWGGNLGAMIVLNDHRNLPWLPVWVQEGNREGHCFVRANKAFIRPVDSSRSAP